MSSPALEAFLARLYTDEMSLAAFLAAPDETARSAGLGPDDVAALTAIDRDGLVMAARSIRAKRAAHPGPEMDGRFTRWLSALRYRGQFARK